jgi:imidazolonepropionase-like amidohydrolase
LLKLAKPYIEQVSPGVVGLYAFLAIVDVNVVPVDREQILNYQTVIIQDGVIIEVGDSDRVEVPAHAHLINGRGKYLLAGIIPTFYLKMDDRL